MLHPWSKPKPAAPAPRPKPQTCKQRRAELVKQHSALKQQLETLEAAPF